ncbi:hypothetical protein HPP92_009555 [Vanilla planifolia]|uniref:Uncharacterized protein n=1 Tax=Vanilla planifolia TaxID=51239 RepID=A0A835R8E1_VANPL|nr:hypothetical protein HPP92_009555 [Vanilla planifolia]
MTVVLGSPPPLPSSPSSPLSCSPNDGSQTLLSTTACCVVVGRKGEIGGRRVEGEVVKDEDEVEREKEEAEQLSLLAFILTVLRKVGCSTEGKEEAGRMEIGLPTDVRHVAHVTFDRFHGFLGLPVEFEPEVPRRAPSASAKSFGVSTDSMQCSYDCRGNSVPSILLLMQRSLYEQGGLRAEGIFRINADNSQEEYVRNQLNTGVVPDGIDVHCLAGLIKAWFRELPSGVLDPLSPEQVIQCQSEEDCAQLSRNLPPTEASLLNWAINLMADVVQEEDANKMNARNVAMVFAPNMTQMADPLTALMYAVQVMNFLKMLILRTLKERQESSMVDSQALLPDPHDENGDNAPNLMLETKHEGTTDKAFLSEVPILDDQSSHIEENCTSLIASDDSQSHHESTKASEELTTEQCIPEAVAKEIEIVEVLAKMHLSSRRTKKGYERKKTGRKLNRQLTTRSSKCAEKPKGACIVSHINSKPERVEAWR